MEALRGDPGQAEPHLLIGRAYTTMGQFDEAIGEYKKALELDPNSPEIHMHLAALYRRLGRIVEADVELKRYKEIIKEKSRE